MAVSTRSEGNIHVAGCESWRECELAACAQRAVVFSSFVSDAAYCRQDVVRTHVRLVQGIADGIVSGGDAAALTMSHAGHLTLSASSVDPITEVAWNAITIVCSTGDAAANRGELATCGVFVRAADTLERSDVGDATHAACLRAVATLCGCDEDKCGDGRGLGAASRDIIDMAVRSGVIGATVACMKRVVASADVAEFGCMVLSVICFYTASARVPIAIADGIKTVLLAMRRHDGVAAVQEEGASALVSIALLDRANLDVIGSAGVQTVVAAMRRHADVARVQAECALALCVSTSLHIHNTNAMLAGGGVDAVVAAMRRHRGTDDDDVHENGCSAISSFTLTPANHKAVAGKGCIDAVVSAMRLYGSSVAVQCGGSAVLDRLGQNPTLAERIVSAGGAEVLVTALRRHPHDEVLCETAIPALSFLLGFTHSSCQVAATRAGGVEVVLAAMRHWTHSVIVQKHGCNALVGISVGNAANRAAIAAAGGIETVVAAMRNHVKVTMVVDKACAVMATLAASSVERQAAIVRAGFVDLLVAALCRRDAGVQTFGPRLLDMLSLNPDIKVAMSRASHGGGSVADLFSEAHGGSRADLAVCVATDSGDGTADATVCVESRVVLYAFPPTAACCLLQPLTCW